MSLPTSKVQLAGYLEGLNRNAANLKQQLIAALDGTPERATVALHLANVEAEIIKVNAALESIQAGEDAPKPA